LPEQSYPLDFLKVEIVDLDGYKDRGCHRGLIVDAQGWCPAPK